MACAGGRGCLVCGDAFDGVAFDAACGRVQAAGETEAFVVLREGLGVVPVLSVSWRQLEIYVGAHGCKGQRLTSFRR